ncbi:aspartate-semialdehyde dehydrogenase [Bacillus safensis FO-36b] [Bacillus safensis subsp. safensis]
MGRGLHVAVVGATGAVGQQMLKTLADRDFEMDTLTLLSSKRSAGTKVTFRGQEYTVQEATPESFEGQYSVQTEVFKAMANAQISVDFFNITPSEIVYTVTGAMTEKATSILKDLGYTPIVTTNCCESISCWRRHYGCTRCHI